MKDIRLYCVVSEEAVKASNGNRGKMGAQIGHAFCGALVSPFLRLNFKAIELAVRYILGSGTPKICLIANEETLHQLSRLYKDKCGTALIKDAGKTVFPRPMITALGIGPIDVDDREDILKGLNPWI
jgi:peptidyl-tRNA hydrolase